MARPGIMIYFEVRKPLSWLPDADKGRLFDAILEYGETGAEPGFDGMLAMAWSFIQPKIDRDQEEYDKTVLKRQYAAFCKKLKGRGMDITYDDWCSMTDEEREHVLSHGNTWIPTTTVTPTTTATPTTTVTPTTTSTATATAAAAAAKFPYETDEAAAAAGDNKKMLMGGKLGKGVIMLSGYETDRLLDRMGVEMFDYYTEKLANYIINKNATVVNHYETILKWYTEDMG